MPHAYPLAARAFGARNLPRLALKSDYGPWAYKSVIIFCFSLYRVRSSKLAYHIVWGNQSGSNSLLSLEEASARSSEVHGIYTVYDPELFSRVTYFEERSYYLCHKRAVLPHPMGHVIDPQTHLLNVRLFDGFLKCVCCSSGDGELLVHRPPSKYSRGPLR